MPAILEMLRIPYTGSQVLTLALTLDKPMTKRVLSYHDLPTPPFQVFERIDEALDPGLAFPLFVKPSREGTGMGISAESIVHDEDQLRAQLGVVLAQVPAAGAGGAFHRRARGDGGHPRQSAISGGMAHPRG